MQPKVVCFVCVPYSNRVYWLCSSFCVRPVDHNVYSCLQVLGILIVLGACIVKLPQIINVWRSKSGEGLPIVSSELENYVYLVHVCYGFINGLPATSYGEAAASWIQNLILLFLLYRFQKCSPLRAASAILVVAAVVTPVYMGLISRPMIAKLYDMNSTIYLASKLPLIVSAFQQVCASTRPCSCCPSMCAHLHISFTFGAVRGLVVCFS